jgi:hypothetical protein
MNENDETKAGDELMAMAGRLSPGITPERDLWPDIERAIQTPAKPEGKPWNTVWAQAAAVLVLVTGSSGLTYLAMKDVAAVKTPVSEGPALAFEPVSGSFGSEYSLGPDYLAARSNLAESLDEKLEQLGPATRLEVVSNMDTIQRAISEINRLLAEEPDNVLLQELLLDAYRNELGLMKKIDDITTAAMRRGDI